MKKQNTAIDSMALFGIIFMVAMIGYILIAIFISPFEIERENKDALVLNWSLLWLYAAAAYIILSFRFYRDSDGNSGTIKPEEIGVRLRFNKPIDTLRSGLPFIPLFIFSLRKLSTLVNQKEFPAEPQLIYRPELKEGEKIPEGMVPPYRVTFRDAVDEVEAAALFASEKVAEKDKNSVTFVASTSLDGLAKRVAAEIVPVVRWKLEPEGGIDFISNIGSAEEVNKQIEDEMFSVLTRILPRMSLGQALQNMRWINSVLFRAVEERTRGWGITIEGAYLKAIGQNHDLNSAIAAVAEAEFQGRADRKLAEQRGAGAASAAKQLAQQQLIGQANGLKALAKSLGIKGDEAIAQFVAMKLAESDNTIVMGADGFSNMLGLAAKAIKSKGDKPDA